MKVMQSFDGLDLAIFLALCAVVLGTALWLNLRGRGDRDETTELWRDGP